MHMDCAVSACPLSDEERLEMLGVTDALEHVRNAEHFLAITNGPMQRLLPHKRLVCGVGKISGERVEPYDVLVYNFPQEYLNELTYPDGTIDSPLMQLWRTKREPLVVDLEQDLASAMGSDILRVRRYGLTNAAAHGLVDVQGAMTSYFCFLDVPPEDAARQIYVLKFLVPHLHVALVRSVVSTQGKAPPTVDEKESLSKRQMEVLSWIHKGKTNWEIARILELSEDTVKYHVKQIHAKLGVINRAQAVAKALRLKLIE